MTESRSLTDKFMLRLPDGMRERIKVSADRNGRSMNAEIIAVLYQYFPDDIISEEAAKELVSNLISEFDVAVSEEASEERRRLANERIYRFKDVLRKNGYMKL